MENKMKVHFLKNITIYEEFMVNKYNVGLLNIQTEIISMFKSF